jgi:hypothetical protein
MNMTVQTSGHVNEDTHPEIVRVSDDCWEVRADNRGRMLTILGRPADVAAWVRELAVTLELATVGHYVDLAVEDDEYVDQWGTENLLDRVDLGYYG